MHYFSTNGISEPASFRDALMRGQPDDSGLYFPSDIPALEPKYFAGMPDLTNAQIAFDIIRPYVAGEIDDDRLLEICAETVDFPFPVVEVAYAISVLELFHGPTLAFKDVGARFMSRCLQHFGRQRDEETVVIVATSGDTGGAVAAGFHGVDGVKVVILYPKDKVSRVQELQLTTLGGNVTTLELRGTFDDCQTIAKRALADTDISSRVHLTSANSINVARWLPQQFYYFFALKQWHGEAPVIAVPSGNFGNLASGMLAKRSGLPVKRFIAACNANDVVPRFLTGGEYEPRPSIATLSNAMDVGAPSNFVRILEMFGRDPDRVRAEMDAVSVSDDATARTMVDVYQRYWYLLDPHGAVAWEALAAYLDEHPGDRGIILETAHPVKFDSVREIIGTQGETPPAVRELFAKQKRSVELDNDYAQVKEIVLSLI